MDDAKQYVQAGLALPTRGSNSQNVPARGTVFGEQVVVPAGKGRYAFADEGGYYVSKNPTLGTGIAGIAATGAFSDLESYFVVKNTAAASTGTRVYFDFLRLIVTAAGANGTDTRFAIKTEPSGVDRYTSGGSAITPVNVNADSALASAVTVKAGALITTAASSGARLVSAGLFRTVIKVVGDQYVLDFGGECRVGGNILEGTAQAGIIVNCPPIILGPQESAIISIYETAQTAASSFEFEFGHWER